MNDESVLDGLLSLWQRERARGRDLPASELCHDRPDLLPQLERFLEGLRRIEPLGMAAQETVPYAGEKGGPAGPELCRPAVTPPSGSPVRSAERFPSGTLLAGRYRIVTLLGRGGMGEVYRADDLKLDLSVALKFPSAQLAHDPERLARFLNEVRVARQVTHPNVCRIYDFGEVDGQPFLSMEYIDGEDLASLLKRIGRLPEDKGVELARQLCAGLAAAHDRGLLHRDLKPHNLMIDGRGQVRVTDFGLAGQAASFHGLEVRIGTPAYQAPEQLAGREVTVQSDLYALGLVLYETFTGKRAFPANSTAELARLHEEGTPASPSSHVRGLNAAIERVIMRCLEKDPALRPRSAVEVAAALPGGDPLAAAMAAGETPSPQLVAHAGGEGSLPPYLGLMLLGLALVGLILAAWLNDGVSLFRQAPSDRSPRELTVRAREVLHELGYTDPPESSACGLATDEPLLKYLHETHNSLERWKGLKSGQPSVMYFWFRQGPEPLAQRLTPADSTGWSMPGRLLPNEPPLREPGMTCVFLDLKGQLLELHAVPPHQAPFVEEHKVDWESQLLQRTGLVLTPSLEFHRVPPVFADKQHAWEGHHPDRPDLTIRVEAASYRGRPVYFHVAPRGHPGRERLYAEFLPQKEREVWLEQLYTTLGVLILPVGGWLAWWNWRLGRANTRGANRLLACYVGLGLAGWLLAAKHTLHPGNELAMFAGMLGRSLTDGLLLWLAYLALEPWVRRRSPWRVIGWNRLLVGGWRDPFVGREVLLGVLGGTASVVLSNLLRLLPGWLGLPPDYRMIWDAAFTEKAGSLVLTAQYVLMVALRDSFLFFILFLLCRRGWLAAGLALGIWTCLRLPGAEYPWVEGPAGLIMAALGLVLLVRAGLLAYVVYNFATEVLTYLPVTIDFSAWYGGISALSLLALGGLATYGFWVACGRRLVLAAKAGQWG